MAGWRENGGRKKEKNTSLKTRHYSEERTASEGRPYEARSFWRGLARLFCGWSGSGAGVEVVEVDNGVEY